MKAGTISAHPGTGQDDQRAGDDRVRVRGLRRLDHPVRGDSDGRPWTGIMALGQLSYQVARWATNPKNNDRTRWSQCSPQCTDVAKLINAPASVPAQYPYVSTTSPLATGYIGKIGYGNTVCGSAPAGGIGVAMACPNATAAVCTGLRPAGTAVQVKLTMDTRNILFLNLDRSGNNPNFPGNSVPEDHYQRPDDADPVGPAPVTKVA